MGINLNKNTIAHAIQTADQVMHMRPWQHTLVYKHNNKIHWYVNNRMLGDCMIALPNEHTANRHIWS